MWYNVGRMKILGYSQAVRHQTLTLAFSLVRIQLSQPKKGLAIGGSFFWLGWRQCDQALAMQVRWFAFAARRSGCLHTRRRARESRSEAELPGYLLHTTKPVDRFEPPKHFSNHLAIFCCANFIKSINDIFILRLTCAII